MKAWEVSIKNDEDQYPEIIYANTAEEAKDKTNLFFRDYEDIEAIRLEELDDKDDLPYGEFLWELHLLSRLFPEYPELNDETLSKEDFMKIWNEKYKKERTNENKKL